MLNAWSAWAQRPGGTFLIGLKGGVNFTQPIVLERYSVLQPGINGGNGAQGKRYNPLFTNRGFQAGPFFIFRASSRVSFIWEILYFNSRFGYEQDFAWNNPGALFPINFTQTTTQSASYFESPLMIRIYMANSAFSPFIQFGGFFGIRSGIQNTFEYEGQIPTGFINQSTVETQNFERFRFGPMGGLGFEWLTGPIVWNLGANARYPLGQIFNPQTRNRTAWQNIHLDVIDELQLLNFEAYLGIAFQSGGDIKRNKKKKKNAPLCPAY